MKHSVTLLLLLTTFFTNAQSPVITRDNYFSIGDTAYQYFKFDTSLWSASAGAAGANVTWDFSAMDFNHPSVIVDTMLFISPVGTPFFPTNLSADYSQANICMLRKTDPFSFENEDYNYYLVNDDSLSFIGHWAANGGTELWEDHYDNFLKELKFPLSFGDAYVDSFTRYYFDQSGSGAHHANGTYAVTVDGYGTMLTPDGTKLDNVIRLHNVKSVKDSSSMGTDSYALHNYSWYAAGRRGFVLSLQMSFGDSTMVETAYYQKQINAIATSDNSVKKQNGLVVFPVPAKDVVTVQCSDHRAITSAELYNALGQRISLETNNTNRFIISLIDLVAGLYILRVETADGHVIFSKITLE